MGKPLTDEQREELARMIPPGNPVRVLIGDIPAPWTRSFLLLWLENQVERGVMITREAGGALTFRSTGGVEHTIPPGMAAGPMDGAQRPGRAEGIATPRRMVPPHRDRAARGAASARRQCGAYAPAAPDVVEEPRREPEPVRHTAWERTARLYTD